MSTKQELKSAVAAAKSALTVAESALAEFEHRAENNVFETLEDAEDAIHEKLLERARNDCEGSYNCGDEAYTQEFIVNGAHYIGTLTCEYDRHDKTYYYLDSSDFGYKLA